LKNKYGLDVDYFRRYFELMARDVAMYTPDEMARSLARMSVVADEKVMKESEFNKDT
jgi:phage anti-repressor protein